MEAQLGAEVLLQLLMYVLFVLAYFVGTAEGSVKLSWYTAANKSFHAGKTAGDSHKSCI